MGHKNEKDKDLERKLKGVMEFYVSTYFEHYMEKLKKEMAKNNYFVETDIIETRLEDFVNMLKDEASEKFHTAAILVLDSIMAGRERRVREFEVLFVDLLKRTLVSDMKEIKQTRPIFIVADSKEVKEN
jgi:hypothetical protein